MMIKLTPLPSTMAERIRRYRRVIAAWHETARHQRIDLRVLRKANGELAQNLHEAHEHIANLRSALKDYGEHRGVCDRWCLGSWGSYYSDDTLPCTCGLADVLTTITCPYEPLPEYGGMAHLSYPCPMCGVQVTPGQAHPIVRY